jgi:hypothetical protein
MHHWLVFVLIFASMVLARDEETTPTPPPPTALSSIDVFRVSAGLGEGTFGWVGVVRGMIGLEGSDWRFGVQGLSMNETKLFTDPNEQVQSLLFLVGRELSIGGPVSATLFTGGGMAASERRGRVLEEGLVYTTYESVHSIDPSVLAGVDVGVSSRRHFGLSLQLGVQVSRITAGYVALLVDAGDL